MTQNPPPAAYTLSRRSGWRRFVDTVPPARPPRRSQSQLSALNPADLDTYNEQRNNWHANLGPIMTPGLNKVVAALDDIVDSNRQTPDRLRGAVAIDGQPSLGKTTSVYAFAAGYDRDQIARYGPQTADGHDRVPVCNVTLTSATSRKTLNRMICEFYIEPPAHVTGNADQLAARALDFVLSCDTRIIFIDEVHFLNPKRVAGLEVINHLKHLADKLPVTFVFAGVDLLNSGLLSEGRGSQTAALAQTGRRWTRIPVDTFTIDDDEGRDTWRRLLLAVERDIVLADGYRGMLAQQLSDYAYIRTTGNIGSLMTLINRGCARAIKRGTEMLSIPLLDEVTLDEAAESLRAETQVAFTRGYLTTRVGGQVRTRKGQRRPASTSTGAM